MLADHLDQHRVIAFEGGVDVGVGTQGGQQVFRHVSGTTAGFAHFLQRLVRVLGGCSFDGGGQRFHLAGGKQLLFGGVGDRPLAAGLLGQHVVVAFQNAVLQQRQRVGARQRDEQAAAVLAVINQSLFDALFAAFELATAVGIADGDIAGGAGGCQTGAADGDAAADQGAQHGEETAVA